MMVVFEKFQGEILCANYLSVCLKRCQEGGILNFNNHSHSKEILVFELIWVLSVKGD